MKKIFPFLFFVFITAFFFKPFIVQHLLPTPADTIVGLYYPFRDMYAKDYPRGVPFKNFLITDPVRQQIPWKYLSIHLEKVGELPLWNPYNFAGYPLLANFQSAVFYPLNALFFLLPFTTAWSIFILLQPLLAGLFLYSYLRTIRLSRFASLLGGVVFAFCGFSVVWLEWGNILSTILWLPLILLSVDKIFLGKKRLSLWYIVYFAAFVFAFFAGHPQTFLYEYILAHVYFFMRWYTSGKNLRLIFIGMPFAFGALLITFFQWFPTLQFILLSARNVDQVFWQQPGWFMPYQNLLQFIAPDFFGNPATLNYWGVWNYAEFSGYIGILPLLFALFAVIFRHDKKTWFFTAFALGSVILALPTLISQLPYSLNIPFLATSQPTRLLSITDFSLAVLVALGCDYFLRKKSYQMLLICEGFIGVFVVIWVILFKFHLGISLEHIEIAKRNFVFPSIFLFAGSLIIFSASTFRFKRWEMLFAVVVFLLVVSDLFRFADKFTPFTNPSYLFSQEKLLSFLQKNISNYRYMTTDQKIMAPNFSVFYQLQSIEGYDPLYLRNYAEFIAASERGTTNIQPPFGFNRIITPHRYTSPFINLLGVKYILSLDPITDNSYQKVFEEGQTKVYENKHVLPRAFFVKDIIFALNNNQVIGLIYEKKNALQNTAIVMGTEQFPITIAQGKADIISYTPNTVAIRTDNTGEGLLVLTDVNYPTWHAFVDNKEVKIHIVDYLFRGVNVPAGQHTVTFSDKLF